MAALDLKHFVLYCNSFVNKITWQTIPGQRYPAALWIFTRKIDEVHQL